VPQPPSWSGEVKGGTIEGSGSHSFPSRHESMISCQDSPVALLQEAKYYIYTGIKPNIRMKHLLIKGLVHPKMTILPLFTHPPDVPKFFSGTNMKNF